MEHWDLTKRIHPFSRLQFLFRSGLAGPNARHRRLPPRPAWQGRNPGKDTIAAIVRAVGVDADGGAIDSLFSKFEGKALADVIAERSAKLSVVGGGASAGAAATTASKASPVTPVDEPKGRRCFDWSGPFG
jgi:ribosomal protein L12E/L44/L45/RPP1/RPP2